MLLTEGTIFTILLAVGSICAALFSLSRKIDRLRRRTSEQTEQILDLQFRLGLTQTGVENAHDSKLENLDNRLSGVEWILRNLTDD